MPRKNDDDHLLDLSEEIMELLQEAGNPENAALVLLSCHAQNYELNANKKLTVDEYLAIYNEQFKAFVEGMKG